MAGQHRCLMLFASLVPLISLCTLLFSMDDSQLASALPLVDPGLFVIMGVKTCRSGSGYCLLGNDCTLDEDFLPDDRGGHCHGLRSAFTPSAHFVCCRYSGELSTEEPETTLYPSTTPLTTDEPESTTWTSAVETDPSAPEAFATEAFSDETMETTTEVEVGLQNYIDSSVENTAPRRLSHKPIKGTRMDHATEKYIKLDPNSVTMSNDASMTDKDKYTTKEMEENTESNLESSGNKTSMDSQSSSKTVNDLENNGIMMHDILKLITEGQWQISFQNNESSEDESTEVEAEEERKKENISDTTNSRDNNINSNLSTNNSLEANTDKGQGFTTDNWNDTEETTITETTTSTVTEEDALDRSNPDATTEGETDGTTTSRSRGDTTTISLSDEIGATDSEEAAKWRFCTGTSTPGDCWLVRFNDARDHTFLCHGARLTSALVLTSAVCAIRLHSTGMKNVLAYGQGEETSQTIQDIAVHENFVPKNMGETHYDVGLVGLYSESQNLRECQACLAEDKNELISDNCYTFVTTIGNTEKQMCRNVTTVKQNGVSAILCSMDHTLQKIIGAGTPLLCGASVAGIAQPPSEKGALFTPAGDFLTWLEWNKQRTRASHFRHF